MVSRGDAALLIADLPDSSGIIAAREKVTKRLLHGSEDNIPFYIAGYKEHAERAAKEKGYSARNI